MVRRESAVSPERETRAAELVRLNLSLCSAGEPRRDFMHASVLCSYARPSHAPHVVHMLNHRRIGRRENMPRSAFRPLAAGSTLVETMPLGSQYKTNDDCQQRNDGRKALLANHDQGQWVKGVQMLTAIAWEVVVRWRSDEGRGQTRREAPPLRDL